MVEQVAGVATAVGVFIALYQLQLARRQARAAFEQEFVNRYWTIEDARLREGHDLERVNELRYLRLCEDEFELMRLGQISWGTWDIWHDGIRAGALGGDDSILLPWTRACAAQDGHRGSQCLAVLEPDPANEHGVFRPRWSPSRHLFNLKNSVRPRLARVARRFG